MGTQITHHGNRQIVAPAVLRRTLRAHGETCYCAPDRRIAWDAGKCPTHRRPTAQDGAGED